MNTIKKVAIIGGGASGLLSAVELLMGEKSFCGEDIVIFEKNDRVGKKLLVTGNGQCNIANEDMATSHYYGDKGFINAFFNCDINICDYFKQLGIYTCVDNGKVYPLSFSASSVLDNIRQFLLNKNVNIITNCLVNGIEKKKDIFNIKTSCGEYSSKYVISAFGGKSGKQFGTDGSSYSLLSNFNHKLTKLYPSLVQLKTDLQYIKGLKGIKERVKLSAEYNGKVIKTTEGDLLFTDYGISGDSVFKISSSITDKENVEVVIELLPSEPREKLESIIEEKKKLSFIDNGDLLVGLVNKRIGQLILKRSKSLKAKDIVDVIKGYRLKVVGNAGFDQSQVTKGGVDTNDVNPFTNRSKLIENLYIVGETLNVDGDCGGYNLSFAFMSGIKASKDIKNRELGE